MPITNPSLLSAVKDGPWVILRRGDKIYKIELDTLKPACELNTAEIHAELDKIERLVGFKNALVVGTGGVYSSSEG